MVVCVLYDHNCRIEGKNIVGVALEYNSTCIQECAKRAFLDVLLVYCLYCLYNDNKTILFYSCGVHTGLTLLDTSELTIEEVLVLFVETVQIQDMKDLS